MPTHNPLRLLIACLAYIAPGLAFGQQRLNLGLEGDANAGRPLALWARQIYPGTRLSFDTVARRQGRSSLRLDIEADSSDTPFAALYTHFYFPIDSVRGWEACISGWVRTEGFAGAAGLYAYAHGPTGTDRIDRVDSLPARAEWRRIEIRLPVKPNAESFGLGLQVRGSGRVWFDDVEVWMADRRYHDLPLPGTAAAGEPAAVAEATPPTAAEVAWLKKTATPLLPADTLPGAPGMAAFGRAVGDAQVVGLGEVTHGSREIFRAKRRLFQYLAEKKGYRTLALEANPLLCQGLNAYIAGGPGDPKALLKILGVWATQELLELVEWMRAYSRQHLPLLLAGVDIQNPQAALDHALHASPPTDLFVREGLARLRPLLAAAARPGGPMFDLRLHPDQPKDTLLARIRAEAAALRGGLELRGKLLKDQSDQARRRDQATLAALRVIEQGATLSRLPMEWGGSYRDACMAEAVLELARTHKVAVWAHNAHVSAALGPEPAMGCHLRKELGARYLALGFAFGTGSYLAEGGGRFYAAQAHEPPPGAYEAWLQQAGGALLLDMRPVQRQAPSAWLFEPRPFRDVGIEARTPGFGLHNLRGEFDCLLYLPTSTPARRL